MDMAEIPSPYGNMLGNNLKMSSTSQKAETSLFGGLKETQMKI